MSRKLHILCVQSDVAECEALKDYGAILDWSMTFARSCEDALNHASSLRFDLIVADQDPPECDGFALIRAIRRQNGPNTETPVMLNAREICGQVSAEARANSVDALVEKPVLLTTFKGQALRIASR